MTIRKYVGRTAQSMGSDPAWVAHPENGNSAVFSTRAAARDHMARNRNGNTGVAR